METGITPGGGATIEEKQIRFLETQKIYLQAATTKHLLEHPRNAYRDGGNKTVEAWRYTLTFQKLQR